MSRIPHDLFLLMLNLSQLDSEDVIKELFVEAISDWTGDRHLKFSQKDEQHEGLFLEIATPDCSFGCIIFSCSGLSEDDVSVLKNVSTTLAVILDSLRNKKLFEQEKIILEEKVHKRTEELRKINAELMSEIMEREQYEHKLIENEARFRDLIENINDVLFTLDSDGVVSYISPVIQKMIGYPPEHIIGINCGRFIHHDDQARIEKKLRSCLVKV